MVPVFFRMISYAHYNQTVRCNKSASTSYQAFCAPISSQKAPKTQQPPRGYPVNLTAGVCYYSKSPNLCHAPVCDLGDIVGRRGRKLRARSAIAIGSFWPHRRSITSPLTFSPSLKVFILKGFAFVPPETAGLYIWSHRGFFSVVCA